MHLTYKLRLRDKHAAELNRQARAVNFVWNYCNETQRKAVGYRRRWLSRFDLQKLTANSSKELNLHGHTIKRVCQQYARSRDHHKKPWLRWRGKRSLGWVPFSTAHVAFDGAAFVFRGVVYETMHLRSELPVGKMKAGSFNCDAQGRWYINLAVEVATADSAPTTRIGIDLGLHDLATLSNGSTIAAPRLYRASEEKLAISQRARKTRRARAIHAKIRNRRKDFLHKASAKIAKTFGLIVVGDVSAKKLAQTNLAKSVLDAGWSDFKKMLSYKAIRHGGSSLEVSEHLTTQTCSSCGALPPERPKGNAGRGIREWTCSACGTAHRRDVNAARNILRCGLAALAEGASR